LIRQGKILDAQSKAPTGRRAAQLVFWRSPAAASVASASGARTTIPPRRSSTQPLSCQARRNRLVLSRDSPTILPISDCVRATFRPSGDAFARCDNRSSVFARRAGKSRNITSSICWLVLTAPGRDAFGRHVSVHFYTDWPARTTYSALGRQNLPGYLGNVG
jgi:hypothetical protein